MNESASFSGPEQCYPQSGSITSFTQGSGPDILFKNGMWVYTGAEFSGIYGWKNVNNGKWNVGESKHVVQRIKSYKNINAIKKQTLMCNAIKKYGLNAFICYKLEECPFEKLHERELYWGTQLNSLVPSGYNLKLGGSGKMVISEEVKRRISISKTGKPLTSEHRTNLSISHKGGPGNKTKMSEKTKAVLRACNKGRKHTPESSVKKSVATKGRKGRAPTEEEKLHLSVMNTGKIHTPESKMKVALALTGRKQSAVHVANQVASKKLGNLMRWLEKESPWFLNIL